MTVHKNGFTKVKVEKCCSTERHQLWVKQKLAWGQEFILVLPQATALPGSDAGSHGVKSASSFVVKNHQTTYFMSCSMQATLLRRGLQFVPWCRTHNPVKKRDTIVHEQMKLPTTSLQVIDLHPSNKLYIVRFLSETEQIIGFRLKTCFTFKFYSSIKKFRLMLGKMKILKPPKLKF